jgi:hypothetical protein
MVLFGNFYFSLFKFQFNILFQLKLQWQSHMSIFQSTSALVICVKKVCVYYERNADGDNW